MIRNACDEEFNKVYSILNFRLPYRFKKLCLIGAALIFVVIIGINFSGITSTVLKDIMRSLILFLLLLASLSKDQLEDEYNRQLRFQSYVIAFVAAATYAIIIPLLAVVIDTVITKITGDGHVQFYDISAFEVLFIMLGFQLLCFETLKRIGRAQ